MEMITEYSNSRKTLTKSDLCEVLGIAQSTYYRWSSPKQESSTIKKPSPRKLSQEEENEILSIVNSEIFCDMAPAEIFFTLLDQGLYYCSERTIYRIMERNRQNIQRRQKAAGNYSRPELLATKPNQLWSWDITKLKGAKKWTYYYLYKIMDVYTRYVVGWMVAYRESAELAEDLIAESCFKQQIQRDQLTLHADRGSSMKSNLVGHLLADLGVTKTHSRPHVSNDNPYSESAFKTLKYRPGFPENFGSIEDARTYCRNFFFWYNNEHRHSGIAMLTPEMVHYNLVDEVIEKRNFVLKNAYKLNPNRFVKGVPKAKLPENEVWINKPVGLKHVA
jgi:putative transposase